MKKKKKNFVEKKQTSHDRRFILRFSLIYNNNKQYVHLNFTFKHVVKFFENYCWFESEQKKKKKKNRKSKQPKQNRQNKIK